MRGQNRLSRQGKRSGLSVGRIVAAEIRLTRFIEMLYLGPCDTSLLLGHAKPAVWKRLALGRSTVKTEITDAAKLTERFHRINFGRLEIELTVDDPKAFTKPWTVTLEQRLEPDMDLLEAVCLEN